VRPPRPAWTLLTQHSKDRFDEGSIDDHRRAGGIYEEESVLSDSAVVEGDEEIEEYRPRGRSHDSYDEVDEPEELDEPSEVAKPKVFNFSGCSLFLLPPHP
jgi:hypothetical protein